MYAVLRLNTYDPDRLAAGADRVAEFDRLHGAQPGFLGSAEVDLGDGKRFFLNLWESAEAAEAGRRALGPVVDELLGPLMAAPSQLVGAGPVIDPGPLGVPGQGRSGSVR
jgi:hypothetical protein